MQNIFSILIEPYTRKSLRPGAPVRFVPSDAHMVLIDGKVYSLVPPASNFKTSYEKSCADKKEGD